MDFRVSVGESDFAALRTERAYYVDKTEILYELVHNTNNKVTLFTRPRRFGKTLMISMMENFFSIRKDSTVLFEGLHISKYEDFCRQWQNQYPVLFISFKDVEGENFEDAYDMLGVKIAEVCKEFSGLLDEDIVDADDKDVFRRLKSETGKKSDIKNSLKIVMRMLYTVYGKKVILLIDEYDVPLAKASERDDGSSQYYARMLDVIRGMMSTALKDNQCLQFAVITGCLRLAKESIFTGTNNFTSYSVLDKGFSSYFGFTQDEVNEILTRAGRNEKAQLIKEWYDGYVFGDSYVYCPWDVINYLSVLIAYPDTKPKNYWRNTSHNSILLTFVKRSDLDVKDKFEVLLNGGAIQQTITDELTYDTLHAAEDNLWSVLLMTGYITKADSGEDGETIWLRIPNKEISTIFEDAVARYFVDAVDADGVRDLITVLWAKDVDAATEKISALLWDTISYNDYHEDYYHAFLAGIFVGRGYSVESNKEKGLGRPDILLRDHTHRRALIIEAKKAVKERDMEKLCDEALQQIVEKKYAKGLDGYEIVLSCGICFFQKQAMIKML